MGKLFSITMSFLVLIQSFNLDMSDLAHMDELLEHAKFHSEKYGDTFFVFISKHYGELQKAHEQDHQEEKKEHEKLPFTHHCCTHVSTDFVLYKTEIQLVKTGSIANVTENFRYMENYSSFEKFDIFQPPKQA